MEVSGVCLCGEFMFGVLMCGVRMCDEFMSGVLMCVNVC